MPRDGSANRMRILDSAETLVIERGFSATSLDEVIAAAGTSKGAFFHHFASKQELARSLVDRYADADVGQLRRALAATESIADPVARVDAVLAEFERESDEIMASQSSCLYISVLAERDVMAEETIAPVLRAVHEWRGAIAGLLRDALAARPGTRLDVASWADHVFVTFEGAFVLCRSTGDSSHMRRQLAALRAATAALLA